MLNPTHKIDVASFGNFVISGDIEAVMGIHDLSLIRSWDSSSRQV